MKPWMRLNFDERQQKEIEFCRTYLEKFAHGTDGHNLRMIVAKMAAILDDVHLALGPIVDERREIAKVMGIEVETE